jgi:8-oxo-dGTP pyrophosphatase MutT (NUDIX family)
MKKWKIIKEADVSPNKWFPVLQHTVELPNGKIIDDYFISPMGNGVIVLPLTTNNEIVLIKQYKHGVGEITIELPAGGQQPGLTLEESAIAELEEEAGIKTTVNNLIYLGKTTIIPSKTSHISYYYLAKNLEFNSAQHLDATEDIEIIKVAPKQVLEMIKNNEIWTADAVVTIIQAFLKYPEIFE